ncbi:MAG: carbohydrate ABC transporter permease [Planctomycetes bacterium]|nr:carbohydrate ABC transporter permease [Planctomycetota bacterium]
MQKIFPPYPKKSLRGDAWWAANALLWSASALFLLPFLWLLLTALKPVEQTLKFQWLPWSYRATLDGEKVEVIKERPVAEASVIVRVREGPRTGERLLLPAADWDGQHARIEERKGDVVQAVARLASLETEAHAGWWRVREKFLRKYADRLPRWTCLPESQIEEKVTFWWENFILAVEYLADTEEVPLRFERQEAVPQLYPDADEIDPGGGRVFLPRQGKVALLGPRGKVIDLARYDTLRLRVSSGGQVRLLFGFTSPGGKGTQTGHEVVVRSPVEDLDIPLTRVLRRAGLKGACPAAGLWFEPTPIAPEVGLLDRLCAFIANIEIDSAGSTNGPPPVTLSEARLIHHRATFWTYLGNTLAVCLLGCIGTVLSSSLVAYGFSRLLWPGRDQVFWLVLATMMVPFPVLMVPLFGIFRDLHWVGTLKPLWLPCFFGSAFNIFLLRQFFLTIPQELSDAARIDGCSEFGIYWRIILPLSRPALAVVALFHFLWAWNDFLGPLIYLTRPKTFTLSLALQFYQSQHGGSEWHLLMAMSVLVLLPIVVLFFLTQKTFIQGIATTGMKG